MYYAYVELVQYGIAWCVVTALLIELNAWRKRR